MGTLDLELKLSGWLWYN